MTQFLVTYLMEDDYGRRTRKSYQTEDFNGADQGADFLSAVAAAQALEVDLAAFSELDILSFKISYDEAVTDSIVTGANVDEGATLVVTKVGSTKLANIKVPGPVAAIRNVDGTIDVTNAIVTDFTDNFGAGGNFLISDGEQVDTVKSGRLDK